MKHLFGASRFQKLMLLIAALLVPSLVQAHPGFPGHTHNITPAISDTQTCVVIALAVGLLVAMLWSARRSRVK